MFSTFPAGWPGVGLLLLRAVVGFTLVMQGAAYLNDWRNLGLDTAAVVALTLVGGVCILVGILTPIASLLAISGNIGYALSWIPAPPASLFASKLAIVYAITMATAIAFLGPGAFSLDARLFGRREIFIPATQRSTKS